MKRVVLEVARMLEHENDCQTEHRLSPETLGMVSCTAVLQTGVTTRDLCRMEYILSAFLTLLLRCGVSSLHLAAIFMHERLEDTCLCLLTKYNRASSYR